MDCPLVPVHAADVVVGFILIVGTFASYVPQYISIARLRSSASISYYMLFIGSFVNTSNSTNVVILQFTRLQCCNTVWSGHVCIFQILGVVQLLVQFASFVPVFTLAVVFAKGHTEREIVIGRRLFAAFLGYLCVIAVTAGFILNADNPTVIKYAGDTIGGMALIGTLIQWCPQIYKLYVSKSSGALSVITLAIQAPGSAASAYFQAVAQKGDPTTYLPYVSFAIQQGICLFLCIKFDCDQRRKRRSTMDLSGEEQTSPPDIETQKLLTN